MSPSSLKYFSLLCVTLVFLVGLTGCAPDAAIRRGAIVDAGKPNDKDKGDSNGRVTIQPKSMDAEAPTGGTGTNR